MSHVDELESLIRQRNSINLKIEHARALSNYVTSETGQYEVLRNSRVSGIELTLAIITNVNTGYGISIQEILEIYRKNEIKTYHQSVTNQIHRLLERGYIVQTNVPNTRHRRFRLKNASSKHEPVTSAQEGVQFQ